VSQYAVELHDRPGALERFLGMLRRRRFPLLEAQIRAQAPGWSVVITLGEGCPPPERLLAVLSRDHDVVSIQPADAGTVGSVRRIA
jgi:acetolactate synthase regulatory subunit